MEEDNRPLGIFDSGVGGLTVVREIMRRMPYEEVVYFGDTARVPYGNKSKQTVEEFALQIAGFLVEQNVKSLVVACNTMSALALDALEERFHLPLLGVIEPGARAAMAASTTKRIGVIGTLATISSGIYSRMLQSLERTCRVLEQPCPLFVPLVEEGWADGEIARLIAEEYLSSLRSSGIDSLVLGCTHYPLLKKTIGEVMGTGIRLIDSAEETAREVERILSLRNMERSSKIPAQHKFFVSDLPLRFAELGERFLGQPLASVIRVSIEARPTAHSR
jgi:glutamate racemase